MYEEQDTSIPAYMSTEKVTQDR